MKSSLTFDWMIDTEIVSFDPYFDGFAKMSHSVELKGTSLDE